MIITLKHIYIINHKKWDRISVTNCTP